MNKTLFASVVVGAALFTATASFAQTVSGPQYPYPTSSQQLGVGAYGAYGQVGAPVRGVYGRAVTGERSATHPRTWVAPQVIGEPAPGQEND